MWMQQSSGYEQACRCALEVLNQEGRASVGLARVATVDTKMATGVAGRIFPRGEGSAKV